jgi:hypothetical protein
MHHINESPNPGVTTRQDRREGGIVPGVDVAGREDDFGVWVRGEELRAELAAREVCDGIAVAEELADNKGYEYVVIWKMPRLSAGYLLPVFLLKGLPDAFVLCQSSFVPHVCVCWIFKPDAEAVVSRFLSLVLVILLVETWKGSRTRRCNPRSSEQFALLFHSLAIVGS